MTFSFAGSSTSCLLAPIGLSLAINTRTDMYSIILSSELHYRQLVVHLPLKYMQCLIHICANTNMHLV